MKKTVGLLLACLVGLWGVTAPVSAAVEDSVNADRATAKGWWVPTTDVGWLYTPSFAYDLTGVETRFHPTPNPFGNPGVRTVTVEIYDGLPDQGGHLLRSADFIASDSFAGGDFPSLPLAVGERFFVGFRHVRGLGVNVTRDSGATFLSPIYFDYGVSVNGMIDTPFSRTQDGHVPDERQGPQPILLFLGEPSESPTSAPEPACVALLGMGVLPLLRRRSGRGRSRRV